MILSTGGQCVVAGGGGVHGCQGVYVVAGGNMCGC